MLALPFGLLLSWSAVSAARVAEHADTAPTCTGEFGRGCTTSRAAILDSTGYVKGSWFTREQKWYLQVSGGAPGLTHGELLRVVIPLRTGDTGVRNGTRLVVIYYGQSPAWVRLPDGRTLQTEDHPRRAAPMHAWMALACLGGGAFATLTGIRSGRHEGAWWRRVRAHAAFRPAGLLFPAGCFGLIGQAVGGGTIWSGIAGGLAGLGLGILGWRRDAMRETEAIWSEEPD